MPHSINVEVKVRKGEDVERAIKRFSKFVKKERIIENVIERKQFIKKSRKKFLKNRKVKHRLKQKDE